MGAENATDDAEVQAKLGDLLRLARGTAYPKLERRLQALKQRKPSTARELGQHLDDLAARYGLRWVVEEVVPEEVFPDFETWLAGGAPPIDTPRHFERYYTRDSGVGDGPKDFYKWGDDYDEWADDWSDFDGRIDRDVEKVSVSPLGEISERKGRRNPRCRICGQKPMVSRIHGRCGACQKYYERHGRERSEFLTPTTKDVAAEDAEFVAERARVALLPKARQDAAEPRPRREVPMNPGYLDDPAAQTS